MTEHETYVVRVEEDTPVEVVSILREALETFLDLRPAVLEPHQRAQLRSAFQTIEALEDELISDLADDYYDDEEAEE